MGSVRLQPLDEKRRWNAAAERLFGYTAEQAIGRHISLVIPPERVTEAHNGQTALEAIAKQRPDVVLLDIGLPMLNGYEGCHRIRKQPRGSDTIVIALTGWGQEDDRRRSHEAGFDGHLVKPVEYGAPITLLDSMAAVREAQ